MKNYFIEQEKEFLSNTEKLLVSLLEEHLKSNRHKIDVFSERRIKDVVKRSIQSEKEFLYEDPTMYKELYCSDQDLN